MRIVALLLVLVGLQAGAFRDLDTGHEWYFGAEDNSAAVMAESREADRAITGVPAAHAPSALPAPVGAATEIDAAPGSAGPSAPRAFRPHATGPPRA